MSLAPRSRTGAGTPAGVYIGTVTRITGGVCYVEVPRLAPGYEYGPARYPGAADATGKAGGHAHAETGEHQHGPAGSHDHTYGTNVPPDHTSAAPDHQHPAAGSHAHDPVLDHKHPLEPPLAVGDDVAVAFLAGGRDELVVLVRLAPA